MVVEYTERMIRVMYEALQKVTDPKDYNECAKELVMYIRKILRQKGMTFTFVLGKTVIAIDGYLLYKDHYRLGLTNEQIAFQHPKLMTYRDIIFTNKQVVQKMVDTYKGVNR